MIDLTLLYTGMQEKISLDGIYSIPKEKYEKTEIIDLSEVKLEDSFIIRKEEDYTIQIHANGKMKIKDSITLDEVWYEYNVEIDDKIDEFVENNENYLDIIEILWQNIVLEVPLRYTEVKDYSKYRGDGWKLVSEEDLVNNNPFNTLLKDEDRSD